MHDDANQLCAEDGTSSQTAPTVKAVPHVPSDTRMPLLLPAALVESEFGSAITITTVDATSTAISGHYHPVPTSDVARLEGKVTSTTDGAIRITGTWRHSHGDCRSGIYEMSALEASPSTASGWWRGAEELEEEAHPWTWQGLTLLDGEQRNAAAAVPRLALALYGEACAWLFLGQTLASFGFVCAGMRATAANLFFNAVFSVGYASFVGLHLAGWARASRLCVAGVVSYLVGYVALAVSFAALLPRAEPSHLSTLAYATGALSFVGGSVCLACDGLPRRCASPRQQPLFWATIAFLVGSAAFAADVLVAASDTLVTGGAALFVVGRMGVVIDARRSRLAEAVTARAAEPTARLLLRSSAGTGAACSAAATEVG